MGYFFSPKRLSRLNLFETNLLVFVREQGIMYVVPRMNKLYRNIEKERWESVMRMLQNLEGARLARQEKGNGTLCLHLAIFNKAPDTIIEALIEANVLSVRKKSRKNRWVPLHVAVCHGASTK